MYADEGALATFTYKFFLKDFHSRGFKRSYVLNVTSTHKFLLFNSWLHLVHKLEVVVAKMRADAENHFNHEHTLHTSVIRSKSPTKSSKGMGSWRGTEREYQGGKQTRSLVEMTDNPLVFQELHVAFVALMKDLACGLVSASEVERTAPSQLAGLQGQEGTEGFMKVSSHCNDSGNKDSNDSGNKDSNDSGNNDSNDSGNKDSSTNDTSPHLSKVTPTNMSHTSAPDSRHSLDGREETSCREDACIQVFSHPRVLMKVLGPQNFTELLHHLLVGHQVIVRAKELPIISSIINCLKTFLPRQSERLITPFTRDYSTDQHNKLLIGMPLLPLLPSNLRPCLILDVSGVHMLKKACHLEQCWVLKRHKQEIQELVLRYYMLTLEKLTSPSQDESLVECIQSVLLKSSLENSLADWCLHSLKQEWIDKAKIFKACMRADRQNEEKVLQVIGAKHKDRQLLLHWASHYCP